MNMYILARVLISTMCNVNSDWLILQVNIKRLRVLSAKFRFEGTGSKYPDGLCRPNFAELGWRKLNYLLQTWS